MAKTTRDEDMGHLVTLRDRGDKRAGKMLERVYKQSKNEDLEQMRKQLIDAHKARDVEKANKIEKKLRAI